MGSNIIFIIKSLWKILYEYVYDFIYNFRYTKKYINNHRIIQLETNVFVIENVISDSLCDELIYLINNSPVIFRELSIEKTNNTECFELLLNTLQEDKYKKYDSLIFPIAHNCFDLIQRIRGQIKIRNDCGYSIRKFYGKTHEHIDWTYGNKNEYRVLSTIISLNDNYEGGLFNFTNHNISYKLKKGSALLFPPYWTHPHNVTAVKPGQYRYTINTWALCLPNE